MSNFNTIHNSFRLNGSSFSSPKELLIFAKHLSPSTYTFLTDWFNNTNYIVVNTSGSTGTPKTVQLKKKHMVNSAQATGKYFYLPAKTSVLLCLSTEFIAGKMMLVRALILGWHIDIFEPNSDPLRGIEKTYDFCAMVPIQLHNSIDKLYLIKKLIVGGGAVSKDLQKKIEHLKTEILGTYGMTETITHIAVKKLNNFPNDASSSSTVLSASSVERSYYSLLPNVKISKDNKGCLVIDAPKISDALITTNDLVEILSDNEFKWLGRYDSVINSGGIKISPEMIEEKLENVITQRFFMAGIPDPILGEKLIIVIESENIEQDLMEKVKKVKTLSKFEIPKELYTISAFVETETKKINRKKTLANLNPL